MERIAEVTHSACGNYETCKKRCNLPLIVWVWSRENRLFENNTFRDHQCLPSGRWYKLRKLCMLRIEPGSQPTRISAHKRGRGIVPKGDLQERVRRKLGKNCVSEHKRGHISKRNMSNCVACCWTSKIKNEKCSLALEIRRIWGPLPEDSGWVAEAKRSDWERLQTKRKNQQREACAWGHCVEGWLRKRAESRGTKSRDQGTRSADAERQGLPERGISITRAARKENSWSNIPKKAGGKGAPT